jgi:hypothetical protein
MMMEPFKKGKNNATKMKRKDLRVLIGILTGHSCLRKFLHRIGKAEDPYCLQCNEDMEEDMKHLLTECPAFARVRLEIFGNAFPDESVLKCTERYLLLKFAKATGLYGTFFRD